MRRLLFTALFSTTAWAHPVSYQGAIGIMTWNQPFLSDYWVTYSLSPRYALAARAMRMEMPGGTGIAYFPQFDWLLKRWNEADSQANVYLYGGVGGGRFQSRNGYAALGGIEADWESRRLFLLGKWETMGSNVFQTFHHAELRVGAAPYAAEFNELASWLMLQIQYHPSLRPTVAVTPLIRMYYRNVLWEAGVSVRGEWMLNLMFHF